MAIKVDKESKRKEILRAAMLVFSRKGMEQSRIEDIAEEAGIAKGTLYLYFKSKEEVFQEIIQTHHTLLQENLIRLSQVEGTPAQRLNNLILSIANSDHYDIPSNFMLDIWGALSRGQDQAELKNDIAKLMEMIRNITEEGSSATLFRDIDSDLVSKTVMAFLFGLTVTKMLGLDKDIEKTAGMFLILLGRGMF